MIFTKLYFESEFPLLGGLFYKTFWFEASLYMFLIFFNFRGSFFSLIFGLWKFWNNIWIKIPTCGGVCFIKFLDLRPPYICFWFFGTLWGLFWVWFLVFENFRNCILNKNSHFWGVHYFRRYTVVAENPVTSLLRTWSLF